MQFATRPLIASVAVAATAVGVALAQDGGEKSYFETMLEGMLSTPERQVTLDGLEGVFSSNPTVEHIAVADRDGVWLTIDNVDVSWNRTALLRRTLDIDSLSAARLTVARRPASVEVADDSAGGGLPLNLAIDGFSLPAIVLEAPVAGAAAELAASGSAQVRSDVVAARVEIDRQDSAGHFSADLRLQPEANILAATLGLEEPAGGLLADLLQLRGRPAIALTLKGDGPLAGWRGNLAMSAGGAEVLSGTLTVSRTGAAYDLAAELDAALGNVVPEAYAALLAGRSRLSVAAVRADDGAVEIESASLQSAGASLSARASLAPDMAPLAADLSLRLGQAGRTTLPFVPGGASVAGLSVDAGLDSGAEAPWRINVTAEGVESAFGSVGGLSLAARGQAHNLADPAARSLSFSLEGSAEGVTLADPALSEAAGQSLRLSSAGRWSAGAPVAVEALQLVLAGATAGFSGTATAESLDGRLSASATDLSRFSGLAGRELAGAIQLQANGALRLDASQFDLALGGEATDLRPGVAALDPLLAGPTRLSGRVARNGDGFTLDALSLANQRATATASGRFAPADMDLELSAGLADLSLVTPRAAGDARLSARLTGTANAPHIEAEASGDNVVLMGRPLTGANARFAGTIAGPQTSGEASLSGRLGDVPVSGAARLAAGDDGARLLEDLLVTVGESRAQGSLSIAAGGLIGGRVSVASPDLSKVAPLFLVEARGMLRADIQLSAEGGRQAATVDATATDIAWETLTLDTADVSGTAQDLFGAPQLSGRFAVRNLTSGGLTVLAANGTATRQGQATSLAMDARLADGSASLAGSLSPQGAGLAIGLSRFAFSRPGAAVNLAAPTIILVENGSARFDAMTLNVGGGSVTVAGRAGSQLDLTARLANVPAALVNSFAPDLGAEGAVSGSATVTGTAAAPNGRFDVSWQGASVAATRNAGLGALSIAADGTLAGGNVTLASRISGAGGLALEVGGRLGAAANAPLDLTARGAVPLALGNASLAERGAALDGALNVDVAIRGTASAPQFSGRITSEGGGFVDPESGMVLRDLRLLAAVSNQRLVLEQLSAQSGDGSVSATGSLGLTPGGGFPVDMRAQVRQARYVDGAMVATRFDADLTLTGSLASGTLLGGTVFLDRTEVTVPESLPRNSIAVDVENIDPSPPVERTIELARGNRRGGSAGSGGGGDLRLDVRINAPRAIFVRGRGLDAELGGDLRLTGPISALVADGAFTMRRGRLDILTQRIAFDRGGSITFAGDLDPILEFSGTTQSGDVAITVSVAGEASDPEVTFSSVPELPQDEVLAYLIFDRGIGELSPLQITRLAAAAAELSGAGGGGLLSSLRASTGLDDIDIVTDAEGAPAIAAGRYVSENVYIGVQQGATTESSRVTIDLDITDDVKARAGVSPSGDSSLGIFFEREY